MKYQAFLDQLPVPVCIHRDGQLLYANQAALELLANAGVNVENIDALKQLDFFNFISPEQRSAARETYSTALTENRPILNITRTVSLPTGQYQLSASIRPVDWEGQPALQLAIVFVDPLLAPVSESREEQARKERLGRLSPRERSVCGLLAQGFSTLNIATVLGIAENTVRNHLRSAYKKTQTHSRVELTSLMMGR